MSFPPDGPLLIVSPHLDDAALSCGALIARPDPVEILTVFTGRPVPPRVTDWDRACGFSDSDEAIAARLDEERAAFADTPHRLHRLDLLQWRYLTGPRTPADGETIGGWITRWVDAAGPVATVAVPACAGRQYEGATSILRTPGGSRRARIKRRLGPPGRILSAWVKRGLRLGETPVVHDDHRAVRDAALPVLVGRLDVAVLLYEEIPYLWGQPADEEVQRVAAAVAGAAHPMSIEIERGAKARRVGAYRSQIDHLFTNGCPLDDPEGLPPVERYWRLVPGSRSRHDPPTPT